ncbi:MAG: dipicolinate synthase subunit DpsA [Oscillospiraceae bacterium]|nr:dipicolinate synthase subunit DpsA [Oscillospiraceae bacterium]
MKNKILVAGGDLRQVFLAMSLSREYNTYIYGIDDEAYTENLKKDDGKDIYDAVILPIPVTNDGETLFTPFSEKKILLSEIAEKVKKGGIIFGGRFGSSEKMFKEKEIETIDYLSREELSVMNAVATAEGALGIAMEESPETIFGNKILITGFGRIAKTLAKILVSMGANVTVCARKKSDIAWAEIFGCKGSDFSLLDEKSDFKIIFNTVPTEIFTKERLSLLNPSAVIIDLASKPGGVDFSSASLMGIKTIWALSLPGKVAPVTSGEIIAKTIRNILTERGDMNV